jgi:hypothetical protein
MLEVSPSPSPRVSFTRLERYALLKALDACRVPNSFIGQVADLQEKLVGDWDWIAMSSALALDQANEATEIELSDQDRSAFEFIASHSDGLIGGLAVALERKRRALEKK